MSIFSVNVVNMLGIGLGIDYGLLIVNRFREERGRGLDVHDAVVATVASAGTTVVFSALTVAVAMCGLFVFGVPLLTSFGIAGLAVVLLSMVAAITLLPATLAVVGGRIKPSLPAPDTDGRFYRLARWVQVARSSSPGRWRSCSCCSAPRSSSARFENGDARTLPRSSEVRATALTLAERFPARGTDPVTVIADVDADDPAFDRLVRGSVDARTGVVGARSGRTRRRPDGRRSRPGRHLPGSAGDRARRAAPRRPAVVRHRGRRTGRRADRRQGPARQPAAASRPPSCASPRSCCCS